MRPIPAALPPRATPGTMRVQPSSGPVVAATEAVLALAALAQETRLGIFRLLVQYAPEGLTPGTVADALDLAPATLSFHLKELSNAGLVTQQRNGRHLWYRANVGAMTALLRYLTEQCCRGDARRGKCAPACADDACSPSPLRKSR